MGKFKTKIKSFLNNHKIKLIVVGVLVCLAVIVTIIILATMNNTTVTTSEESENNTTGTIEESENNTTGTIEESENSTTNEEWFTNIGDSENSTTDTLEESESENTTSPTIIKFINGVTDRTFYTQAGVPFSPLGLVDLTGFDIKGKKVLNYNTDEHHYVCVKPADDGKYIVLTIKLPDTYDSRFDTTNAGKDFEITYTAIYTQNELLDGEIIQQETILQLLENDGEIIQQEIITLKVVYKNQLPS